jgi:hypothetical protein
MSPTVKQITIHMAFLDMFIASVCKVRNGQCTWSTHTDTHTHTHTHTHTQCHEVIRAPLSLRNGRNRIKYS